MQRAWLLFILLFYFSICNAQRKPRTLVKVTPAYTLKQTDFFYRLGDKRIGVTVYQYKKNPAIAMIHVHDDETTALETSKEVLRKTGGYLITIRNKEERLISFTFRDTLYKFDPNRMFSRKGIAASLIKYGNYSDTVVSKIHAFAKFILGKIPASNTNLIALHNNHKGSFSVDTYDYNGRLNSDSRAVYTDSSHDKDDFFLTTDELLYNKIRSYRYNVILQDNKLARDDGSLSIYYGKRRKSYVNVETEHGKSAEQLDMLTIAINRPKKKNRNSILFNYEIKDSIELKSIANLPVYFGDNQVGVVLSALYSERYKINFGQLEINDSFPLNANTDFFLITKSNGSRVEIRIDPTSKPVPLDWLRDTIEIIKK